MSTINNRRLGHRDFQALLAEELSSIPFTFADPDGMFLGVGAYDGYHIAGPLTPVQVGDLILRLGVMLRDHALRHNGCAQCGHTSDEPGFDEYHDGGTCFAAYECTSRGNYAAFLAEEGRR